ncbi:hypothetical protein IFM89_015527 [Coptis chinensis]|uniref:Late embryogenesis abundant protein LEA-2 subgroup domain-containing protein n=1 Tax=Coptis chinensis TaxID=261450 RepID=A0A835ITM6_9MAGN|nr:hypothetical protein IFM89_015527 [Coptis chinensis]
MQKINLDPKRTHPLVWITAIICTIISVAVIIAGLVIFIGYMIIRPTVPFISVAYANLDNLQYDRAGHMDAQMTLLIKAENDNGKAHATFSDLSFYLYFENIQIAKLTAGSFDVLKNTSVDLHYLVQSSSIPLEPYAMEEMDASLKHGVISFQLSGKVRTRWRVGATIGSVKFWSHLSCQLNFLTNELPHWVWKCPSSESRVGLGIRRKRLERDKKAESPFLNPFQLVMHLHEMQVELEDLAWDKKQLGEQLERATKDCKILGSIISELEEEHDEAMAKIDHLENELQHLKDEYICENVIDDNKNDLFVTEYDTSSLRSEDVFQDLLMHRKEGESNSQPHGLLKTGSGVLHPISPGIIPRSLPRDEALDKRWGVALSQSFFSTTLSLLVGIIIWQAQDACMPLVVALFIVVGMSLRSVVQFFYTIENRPASDTVALLSVNWFVLGTLTYPTLPKVARVFVPLVLSLADKMVYWFGLSSFCG